MRTLLSRQSLAGWILAAMAAGGLTLPAAAAQSAPASKSHKSTGSNASAAHSKTKGTTPGRSGKSSKSTSRKKSKRVKGQAEPAPERISEIQTALAKHGVFVGEPNGKWDESTTEAMKRFQTMHGLTPTGKFDALTLQKLGLGSETAGVAAPTPPPNATANRLLSRNAQRDEIKNENQPE
jgi:peptidoglycan hydrolase-like protein with peptidoglycan-binding domain